LWVGIVVAADSDVPPDEPTASEENENQPTGNHQIRPGVYEIPLRVQIS